MEYNLSSSWERSGNNYMDFKALLRDISQKTYIKQMDSQKTLCMNVLNIEKNENKNVSFTVCCDSLLRDKRKYSLPAQSAESEEFKSIEKEIESNRLILAIDKGDSSVPVFVDNHALITLGQKIGLSGDWFFNPGKNESLCVRNAAITAAMKNKDCDLKFMIRQVGSIRKIFACFSEKYPDLKQEELIYAIDEFMETNSLGKMVCDSWSVDQFLTKITFSFPDYADELACIYGLKRKLIPCITFMTSDTGDCSLKVISTWKTGNSYSYLDEFSQKHIGDINMEQMYSDIENHIFADYCKVPERLCELMQIQITDTKNDFMENKVIYSECLKRIMQELHFVKAIGKKNDKYLYDILMGEYNSMINYTAYDICMSIMELPEKISGLDRLKSDNLAKACGQAPFAKKYIEKKIALAV